MNIISQYTPEYEEEKTYKKLMLRLYKEKSILAFYRENIEAHFTASAWILNPKTHEVLLLHHKKLDKWLQPGGHTDGETNFEKVARKEANEETALENLQIVSDQVFDIDIHLIPENKGIPQHDHFDVRFAYFCMEKEKTKINSESKGFQWIKIKDVETLTNEPSILRMVEKSKKILNGI
jgi:8-oxo-dGTP pyrophosphatase MutT (NUDIX family)